MPFSIRDKEKSMCVTRVAKVISIDGDCASVKFLDDKVVGKVDVSMVKVSKNSYVEVFADTAISRLSPEEAKWRKELWIELRKRKSVTVSA